MAYWVVWFGVDRRWLATADTPAYYAFENAFPLADGWIAVTAALGAWALQRRKASGALALALPKPRLRVCPRRSAPVTPLRGPLR